MFKQIKMIKLVDLYYKLFNDNIKQIHNALEDTKMHMKCYYEMKKSDNYNVNIIKCIKCNK